MALPLTGFSRSPQLRCRILGLGEYYEPHHAYRCSGVRNTSWASIRRLGRLNMSRYRVWMLGGKPTPIDAAHEAAERRPKGCRSMVDLRDGDWARRLNLTRYLRCLAGSAREKDVAA